MVVMIMILLFRKRDDLFGRRPSCLRIEEEEARSFHLKIVFSSSSFFSRKILI
jgi:hypothetical protein